MAVILYFNNYVPTARVTCMQGKYCNQSLGLIKYNVMMYGGVEAELHVFFGKKSEVKATLRPKVSRAVCPGARHPFGIRDQFNSFSLIIFSQFRVG
jgi:hypothetical protein